MTKIEKSSFENSDEDDKNRWKTQVIFYVG